jgi:ribosomal-protein-serine acetyltransferase
MGNFSTELYIEGITLAFMPPNRYNANIVFNTIESNRAHLLPWLPWASQNITKSPKDSLKFLKNSAISRKKDMSVEYGIFYNNEYMGNIGLFRVPNTDGCYEWGVWLDKNAFGKGMIGKAICAIETEAFTKLNINRIQMKPDSENTACIKVAKKAGYTLDGCIRQAVFLPTFGSFRDCLLFSKLQSEFSKQ